MAFITAKTDRVFKAILGDEDNKDLLREFLERIFKTKVEVLEFLQPELTVQTIEERTKTVDLLVKMNDKFVHIELNSQNQKYLHNRNFIFFTSIFNKKTKRGKEYDLKTEYIHIDFTYGLKKDDDEVREYYVMDKKGNKYIENIKIIEYNMDKITKYFESNNEKKIEEYKHLIMLDLDKSNLRKLSKGDDFIMKFDKELEELNERETYEPAMTWEEDFELRLNTEKREVREQVTEEVTKEVTEKVTKEVTKEVTKQEKTNIAKNMLSKNMEINLISEITGLSVEEIEKLK